MLLEHSDCDLLTLFPSVLRFSLCSLCSQNCLPGVGWIITIQPAALGETQELFHSESSIWQQQWSREEHQKYATRQWSFPGVLSLAACGLQSCDLLSQRWHWGTVTNWFSCTSYLPFQITLFSPFALPKAFLIPVDFSGLMKDSCFFLLGVKLLSKTF